VSAIPHHMTPDRASPPARVVETHISVLVFIGDQVYKLRKPVHFGFLDFTDRSVREADCQREVELNRRLAPDVYLGVADIVMDGEPIDHMVVMRALPAARGLATLLRAGEDVDGWLREIASVLSRFHAGAARSPAISAAATEAALRSQWEANFEETGRFVGSVLDAARDREAQMLVRGWLPRHRAMLDDRMASGRVCDGHGDLQAEDVFCLDDGVRILDCIEFSDELRHGDVCADVAFLAMDLERLGRPDAAERFVHAYETQSADAFPRPLLHHYIARRAYVRAKVACLNFEQGTPGAEVAARELHTLALRHLRRARQALLLVGGLPGSGKSTLAAALAVETGWALMSSDEIRRELLGEVAAPLSQSIGSGRYSPDVVGMVYDELLQRARQCVDKGGTVILDASWTSAARRSAAARAAADSGSELLELCCTCEDEVAARRITARRQGEDASEATPQVRAALAESMDAWPSATTVDTTNRYPAECLSWILPALAAEGDR
jgi:aminoglycoside phosphotransferase family enzyme/predicted kinase